jgi:hypothetical protein
MLLAGEYPGAREAADARAKLAKCLDAGIRTFVDLTEQTEDLRKYDQPLRELSVARGLETKHIRCPIRDVGLPRGRALARRWTSMTDLPLGKGSSA